MTLLLALKCICDFFHDATSKSRRLQVQRLCCVGNNISAIRNVYFLRMTFIICVLLRMSWNCVYEACLRMNQF